MLKQFEKAFAVVMLSYCCGAFDRLIGVDQELGQSASDSTALAVEMALYSIASILFLLHAKQLSSGVLRGRWLLALVALAVCSTAWSEGPSLTLRRSLVMAGTALFGIYLGSRFQLHEQIRIVAWTLLVLLLLSTGFAVGLPQYGLDIGDHTGNWQGLFEQKNTLARIAVLAVLAFLAWRPRWWPLRYIAMLVALVVLAMTRSATGIVVLAALFSIVQLLRITRLSKTALLSLACFGFAGIGVFTSLLFDNREWLAAILSRDLTLTGRTDLWSAVIDAIAKRPIFGYGFSAFWPLTSGESSSVVALFSWARHAHNGLLDLWLDLGAVGLILFLIGFVYTLRNAFAFYSGGTSRERVWPLAYLAFMFLYNITESSILIQNSVFLMLYAMIAVSLRVPSDARDSAVARFHSAPNTFIHAPVPKQL